MSKRHFKQHRPLFSSSINRASKRPKIHWKILPVLWLALKRMATVLGFVMIFNSLLILMVLPAFVGGKGSGTLPSLPQEMVLFIEFEDGFAEVPQAGGFLDPFAEPKMTLRELVGAIDSATSDKRVKGILARIRDGSFSMAQTQEVRAAIKRFRDAGKFAHIYSSSYGEGGGGLGRYYLASAFDQIWMQPLGVVSVPGISADMPFMRGTLDKLGVKPEFFQRKDYKTAYENITDKGLSPANRETVERLIGDIRDEVMKTIPAERGLDEGAFASLVDKALLTAKEAEESGLITHADYGDVLLEEVAEHLSGERDVDNINIVDLDVYAAQVKPKAISSAKPQVALIYVNGAIMADDEGSSGGIAAASKIAPAILRASRNDDIDAIILRVDSPGGSPTASESILRAVAKAKEKGKRVIVSMGSTAASGGYWVSAYADRIFVLPSTITGSIGVVGGKFSIAEMSSKIGVNWERVSWGENAGIWSPNTAFSKGESERMNAMMDMVYDAFLTRVAQGRGMDKADVDKIAGGRVWSGVRAVEIGLADEIGGLDAAMDYAAVALGGETRQDIDVVIMPKPKTPFEQIVELLEGQVIAGQTVKMQADIIKSFSPSAEALAQQYQIYSRSPVSTYEALRLD